MGPVLDAAEISALRRLAQEVRDRYPPALDKTGAPLPWDIEFGFAKEKLWLLQIRPLIQRGRTEAEAVVNARLVRPAAGGRVALDQLPGAGIGG